MPFPYKKFNSDEKGDYSEEIDHNTEYYLKIDGYCSCEWKNIIYYILAFLSLGILCLIMRWKPVWKVLMTSKCCPLAKAEIVVLKDNHGLYSVENIYTKCLLSQLYDQSHYQSSDNAQYSDVEIRYFIYKYIRYIWNSEKNSFSRLRGYDHKVLCSDLITKFHGLSKVQQEQRLKIYGPNNTSIEVKSYFNLLINEVLNPFYIFQIASIALWMSDNYYYYASAIFVISVISICISLYETKRQQIALHDMAEYSSLQYVNVCRGGQIFEDIPSCNLVPGDVITIPSCGCHMSCDAVLITGSCIVNESMLTGESVPETKTSLHKHDDDEFYDPQLHKKHTLFSGTEIIQTRYYGSDKVIAVVIRTGFSTTKGELLRAIKFPRPLGFRFYKEAMRFVYFLFFLSSIGMGYTIYLYVERKVPILTTILRALDIITIVVPPALPAALTVGIVYAQNRLKKVGIFCISPPHINVAGKLKLICFDKTGTLTEDGLDLWGVISVDNRSFCSVIHDPVLLPWDSRFIACMATCHSLTMIHDKLTGDPLDLKMFLSTKWNLEEPGQDNNKFDLLEPTVVYPVNNTAKEPFQIAIIRQFPFSSTLQRMSVVCRTLGASHMDLYVKGAPEKIVTLCTENTVPSNFEMLLQNYTLKGFRVLALAWKPLESKLTWHHLQRIRRTELEKNLNFLGLLIMQNMLKSETLPIINTLKKAYIKCVMVTGDNLLTALSVARECGMVSYTEKIIIVKALPPENNNPAKIKWDIGESSPAGSDCDLESTFANNKNVELYQKISIEEEEQYYHFAIDGKSFSVVRNYFPEIFPKLIVRGTIFARMAPDQKTQLVEALQEIGYSVGMCGDGANDCGALKAADVGISLSEAEASVAAPFTSKVANIECVPIVIKEGRCSLVTAVSVFKFICIYSIIQFLSVLILYTVETNLTDQMFLYIDLVIITTLAIVMSNTTAYSQLVKERPKGSLVNITSIISILLQIILIISGQVLVLLYLQSQKWFVPVVPNETEDAEPCWENSAIFLFSCYQYIIAAVVFSKGPPFRKPFYTNMYFMGALIILISFSSLLLFNPFAKLADFLQIIRFQPNKHFFFRLTLLLMAGCSFLISVLIEVFICEKDWLKTAFRYIIKHTTKSQYKKIENDLVSNPNWPNVEDTLYAISPVQML